MNDKTAKLLLEEERFPDGATSPTIHKEYECPCGQGRIVEDRVPGFGDWYAQLVCPSCAERYTLVEGRGHIWELCAKEER